MGAVAPTLFGAIKLLVNNRTAISEAFDLPKLVLASTGSVRKLRPRNYPAQSAASSRCSAIGLASKSLMLLHWTHLEAMLLGKIGTWRARLTAAMIPLGRARFSMPRRPANSEQLD